MKNVINIPEKKIWSFVESLLEAVVAKSAGTGVGSVVRVLVGSTVGISIGGGRGALPGSKLDMLWNKMQLYIINYKKIYYIILITKKYN